VKARSDDPADRIPEKPWPVVPIWFACLAPPVAAILHLQASYVLEHVACSTQSRIGLHVVSLLLLGLVGWSGFVARRQWVKLGSANPENHPGPVGTRRLMALFGMIGALIFSLFILAQWFPAFVLGPCIRT
jgi:hypothetical protein